MKILNKKLIALIDAVGFFCCILLLLMIANVFTDVVMRYWFNNVNIGMQEMEWHLFSAMFLFGIGYTLKENGHVRVDVVYDGASAAYRAIVDLVGNLVFVIPFSILIIYFSYGYTLDAYQLGEGSGDPGGLPHRWIVRSFIAISNIFLILCSIQVIIRNLMVLKGVEPDQAVKG